MKLATFIIGLSIGIYIAAYVLFPAITAMFQVDTGSWNPAAVSLIVVVVILTLIAVVLVIFKQASSHGGGKG